MPVGVSIAVTVYLAFFSVKDKDAGYGNDQKPCFFVYFFLLLAFINKLTPRSTEVERGV